MNAFVYFLVSLILTSLMLSVIFFFAWRTLGRKPSALAWSIAYLFGTLQWTLNALSNVLFDDRRIFWIISGAVALVVISLALIGFRLWAGRKAHAQWLVVAGLMVLGVVTWTTFVQPHAGISQSMGAAYSGVMTLVCASIIWKRSSRRLPAEVGAATVFAIFGVSQLAAATFAFMQGPTVDEFYSVLYSRVNFLALPPGYIGIGLFTVFILASDLSERMRDLARVDQLTEVLNRRGLNEASAPILARSLRYEEPLSVVLCDVDHFKEINDNYGHATGDRVLISLARFISGSVRQMDIVARLGGEEFVIVLPNQDLSNGIKTAERIRSDIERLRVDNKHTKLRITASFGVTELQPTDQDIYRLVARADQAMYRSKQAGRNQIQADTPESS